MSIFLHHLPLGSTPQNMKRGWYLRSSETAVLWLLSATGRPRLQPIRAGALVVALVLAAKVEGVTQGQGDGARKTLGQGSYGDSAKRGRLYG